ncbi:hypothetical protein B0H16DRAFT_280537 [Mycena metata]|uniref:Uncharacterized protein n=1 Tax=Mycena metata TaxID=1033252 RepID=A0AAD7HPQ4_9AGAR|nr:hypothetical protein B0H16DRAFT_280537 [Mycena metata]
MDVPPPCVLSHLLPSHPPLPVPNVACWLLPPSSPRFPPAPRFPTAAARLVRVHTATAYVRGRRALRVLAQRTCFLPIPSSHAHPLPSLPRPLPLVPSSRLASLRRRHHRCSPRPSRPHVQTPFPASIPPLCIPPHNAPAPTRVHLALCTGCCLRALAPTLGANSVRVQTSLPRVRRVRRVSAPTHACARGPSLRASCSTRRIDAAIPSALSIHTLLPHSLPLPPSLSSPLAFPSPVPITHTPFRLTASPSLSPFPRVRPAVVYTTHPRRVDCTRDCTGCRLRALASVLGMNAVRAQMSLPRVRRACRLLACAHTYMWARTEFARGAQVSALPPIPAARLFLHPLHTHTPSHPLPSSSSYPDLYPHPAPHRLFVVRTMYIYEFTLHIKSPLGLFEFSLAKLGGIDGKTHRGFKNLRTRRY